LGLAVRTVSVELVIVLLIFSVLTPTDCAALPNVSAPNVSDPAPPTLILLVVLSNIRPRLIVSLFAEACEIVPLRFSALAPPTLNAPAPLGERNARDGEAGESLAGVSRVVPPKISASLATGAVPPQLAAVLKLLSPPPPFHVTSAAPAVPAVVKRILLQAKRFSGDRRMTSACF
jgi:hypothetical protein